MTDAAMLVLRLGLGIVFLAHGIKHVRGKEKTSNWFASIGFRYPVFNWFMSSATEIAVGVLLILGLGTSLGVAALVGVMFVAFWTVHRTVGFWVTARPDEGYEYVFMLTVAALALAVAGPGEISLDHALGIADDLDGWVGAAFAAGGAVMAIGELAVFWRPTERETS
ncbi:MAG: DoxX family protein [Acidimicrobiia bacterium]|nr:DoxX family protein [Acidimicrobiia bacterium]